MDGRRRAPPGAHRAVVEVLGEVELPLQQALVELLAQRAAWHSVRAGHAVERREHLPGDHN